MDNVIGGKKAGAENVISANGRDGIAIIGGSAGNRIIGNLIGTNQAAAALSNLGNGVQINASHGNFVGGGGKGEGNDILGNNADGILITGGAAMNNTVDSNLKSLLNSVC